jgi:CheY-like chemotaxis protein
MRSDTSETPSRRALILVVDDDPDTQFIVQAALDHAGYAVSIATDGEAAITAVQTEEPDAILLDFALPRLSGPDLFARLKADPATSAIPVIACTAVPVRGDIPALREQGYAEVLLKPVDPTVVIATVQRVCRSASR